MNRFERTVRDMTAKEFIMSMVEGLTNPTTTIDMDSFGHVFNKICYGCAATNTICSINNFTKEELIYATETEGTSSIDIPLHKMVNSKMSRREFEFFIRFEESIDSLRQGDLRTCNKFIKFMQLDIKIINPNNIRLPHLEDSYNVTDLEPFKNLANDQL